MRRSIQTTALLLLAPAVLASCTWVKPSPGGDSVRVAYDGNVTGCREAGQVSVSVADKVAFYHRPELKVRDELETLARNQAAELPADTIKAATEPHDGEQKFTAYVCGKIRVHQRDAGPTPPAPREKGEAETYPIKDH